MAEFVANFELNNNSIGASFDLSEGASFDALFEVYASGTTWGNISGNIENQTDLQEALSELSGNIGELENTVTDNYNELSGAIDSNHQAITEINTTMQGYGDIVTHDVAEFATSAQGAKADTALQPGDDISELNNNEGYITSAAIGDGTLTIQVNNQTVGTFTANQSGNTTANIEVPDSATWGNITGNIEDQTDLQTVLASKQDVLTPGTDIEITQDNTINFTNSSGYITGISGTDVTNALGYTPYDAANPDKFIKNTATGTNSITVNGTATSSSQAINIGKGSSATKSNAVALGYNASAAGSSSVAIGNSAGASTAGISGVAIGDGAKSQAQYAIQLGKGTNAVASTLSIGFGSTNYTLLNGSTGLIPNGRLSTGIARTSDMNAADNNLQAQIDVLKARGRFLALWNCATGLAETNPVSSPYTYQTGDYFIVGVVSTATPPVNYRPDGSSYTTGVASTTVETAVVDVDDVYYYDGTTWHLQINTQKTTAFVNIAGSPYDNIELAQALNSKADNSDITNLETAISAKQDVLTAGTDLEIVSGGNLYNLPTGYTQIEYVSMANSAYADTNITLADTDSLDITFMNTSSGTYTEFITGKNGSSRNTVYMISPASNLIQWNGRPTGVSIPKDKIVNLTLKSGELKYSSVFGDETKTFTGGSVSSNGTCLIGAGWSGTSTVDSRRFTGNIYEWKILDGNGDLRFNGVPCTNPNNVFGFYDVIGEAFYQSISGTDFTGGTEVVAGTVINFTNASGYITGISGTDVTNALGYTPYNSSNPDGYTDNVGTVISVNNVQPDSNGNVTIPTGGTVDQTYDATSANAQSGIAINGAKFLQNTANGTGSITINGTAANGNYAVNIGNNAYTGGYAVSIGNGTSANGGYSVCLGNSATSYGTSGVAIGRGTNINGSGVNGIAIGRDAAVQASNAIQLGNGTNTTANSMAVGFADIDGNGTAASYSMLDGTTGLIPDARLSNNIARTSAIPTSSTVASWGFITGINSSDVTTALGYTPYNSSNPNGYITSSALSPYVLSSSLATVATSGSYNDLNNKPTIPAAQVNSDWNAVSGVAEILNKPTIPTATSQLTNDSGFIDSNDLTDVITVIDDYTSGSIRVRTWSDGTLEEWCWRYTQSTAGAYTITYPVAFTTEPMLLTTYTLSATATTSTTTRNYGYATSRTGFSVYLAANARLAWYARGK